MRDRGITAYHDARDPLWRFAPTPFSLRMCIGRMPVLVESNDPQILAILAKAIPETSAEGEYAFLWKIIRDAETARGIEPATILVDGDLSFLKMGPEVFAGVDREHRELLGFVGTGVCDHAFEEAVLPLFVQLTLEALEDGARAGAGAAEFAFARGNGNE
jgi:hypothetical protein